MKFPIKKNLRLPCLIIFLSLVFAGNIVWFKKHSLLNFLNQKFKETSQALAQEYSPYFFPRFPQRLIYLLSQINLSTEELVKLNEELSDQLKNSDCQFAFSQCLPKITFGDTTFCQPGITLGSSYKNVAEIEEKKEEIADRIDNLYFLKELLKKEMEGGLKNELETLRPEVAEELKNSLKNTLKKSEEIIEKAKENQILYSQDYTKNCIASCKPGPICGIQKCAIQGVGPQKHINIKAKVEVSLNDLKLGEVGIDKFGLALPDKLQFPSPSIGDITINIPPQSAQVCFPFRPIDISIGTPSLSTSRSLSFACPKLSFGLKTPEIPIFKLPKEIKIPFPEVPEIKWCQIPKISGPEELKKIKIKEEIMAGTEKDIEEDIKQIDELIKQTSNELDELDKKELKSLKEDIERKREEIKKEAPSEDETPPADFRTPGASASYQYQSPTSQSLESKDISLSYQCAQKGGDETVNTGRETKWYFATIIWLMEECANLYPIGDEKISIKNIKNIANCYNPDKVVNTIIEECKSYWSSWKFWEFRRYSSGFSSCSTSTSPSYRESPEICKKIRADCADVAKNLDGKKAQAFQCQKLFAQEGLSIPRTCLFISAQEDYRSRQYDCPNPAFPTLIGRICVPENFNPLSALKEKCQELKNKYPENPPEPCKILPLFTGQVESPGRETYSGLGTSCPAQTLLNLPFGFGSGLGFNCPVARPSPPKIVLPDIVIPDISLPKFSVRPFLTVKLPKIIFEDLILPDLELCDLNDCSHIFPSLNFKLPSLNLPSFDISLPIFQPPQPMPQLSNLQLRSRIDFPSINFSLPQLNLFNLLLPELKLPEISIPSPKINFAITGIDLHGIFDLIFTFILNALGKPNSGLCLNFSRPSPSLLIAFPDYYFSFEKFPEVPKIDFCKDINKYCRNVKNALGTNGWLKKAKEIETEFNKTINSIQKELDKVSEVINGELQKQISQVFEEYGKIIYDAIDKQLATKGLSLKDYNYDLSKIPFPGVFPVKTEQGEECLPVFLPGTQIILKFVEKKDFSEPKIENKDDQRIRIIFIPLDLPSGIPIPWPEKLKNIKLINPLTYKLPEIPLSHLSYQREFLIKGPGFQPKTFSSDFGTDNEGDCLAESPKGGNPFPIIEMTNKIDEIKNIKAEMDNASQKAIRILE